MRNFLCILFASSVPVMAYSQYHDNYSHERLVVPVHDTLLLDSLPVFPHSLTILKEGVPLADSLYFTHEYNYLVLDSSLLNLPLTIRYNTMPVNLFTPSFIHDMDQVLFAEQRPAPGFRTDPQNHRISLSGQSGLTTDGSISRGITVGNNQNTGINSNFNLNINGELTDNINIRATISDNNMPLQPEGYTQQIQEFDKVFINLYNESFYSTLGDYDLYSQAGHFSQFHKKLLGAELKKDFYINERSDTIITHSALAVSKGKYNRMNIQGKEGIQGPYLLQGANNERHIVILAGSERVFIDGHLITRGATNDYTIDYNTGELYFTVNQPITKDKRIIVEFEYSDKNYTRYLLYNRTSLQRERSRFYISAYAESDAKNQPIMQGLTEHHKALLREAGDSLSDAFALNVDTIDFSQTRVMYKSGDTLHEGRSYSIFIFSTNPDSAKYAVGFSNVGVGNGNYRMVSSTNNGRVYAWIAPVDGVPQGDFEPVRQLVAPQSHQLYSMGTNFNIGRGTTLNIETALSNLDRNTFSTRHNDDNLGLGTLFQLSNKRSLRNHSFIRSSVQYYHQSSTFAPIERIKTTEFERDWNIAHTLALTEDENSLHVAMEYSMNSTNHITYSFDLLDYGNYFNGTQNRIKANTQHKKLSFTTDNRINSGTFETYRSQFLRTNNNLKYQLRTHTAGLRLNVENNQLHDEQDSLLLPSFSFYEASSYLQNTESAPLHYQVSYGVRKDKSPQNNLLQDQTFAEDLSIKLSSDRIKNNSLLTQFSFRKLSILNNEEQTEQERTLLTRLNHHYQSSQRLLSIQTEYETGSGLERRYHHTYVKVPEGQGTHIWIDYNNNGIQENGEFEPAPFQDKANYIRLISRTEDFIPVHHNEISQTLRIDPYHTLRNTEGFVRHLRLIENSTYYTVLNKVNSPDLSHQMNPFSQSIADSSLINNSLHIRNTSYLNKRNHLWGLQYIYTERHRKNLLTSGFTEHKQQSHTAGARVLVFSSFRIKGNIAFDQIQQSYESYTLNNYHLYRQSQEISGEYSSAQNMDFSVAYLYAENKNKIGDELGYEHNLGFSVRGSTNKGTQIQAKANYIHLSYNSHTNSSLAYQILKGLTPGQNLTWGLSFYRILEQGIEINLSYEGRKPDSLKAVHTGNITMRANF